MFKKFFAMFQTKESKIEKKVQAEIKNYTELYETAKKYNVWTDIEKYERILNILKSLLD